MTPSKGEKYLAYMRRVRAHSLEYALRDSKKEKDLDWQKMTAIAEDYDRMNIGESSERANYISRGNKKPNRGGQKKKQDRPANNQGTGVPPQLQGKCL